MAKPPVTLSPEQQLKYDELYQVLGKQEADDYAFGVSKPIVEPTAPPSPPVPLPPTRRLRPRSGTAATGATKTALPINR